VKQNYTLYTESVSDQDLHSRTCLNSISLYYNGGSAAMFLVLWNAVIAKNKQESTWLKIYRYIYT